MLTKIPGTERTSFVRKMLTTASPRAEYTTPQIKTEQSSVKVPIATTLQPLPDNTTHIHI